MTALPPLLQLAAGRKGRPRCAPTIDDALAALDAWGSLTIKIPVRAGGGGAPR